MKKVYMGLLFSVIAVALIFGCATQDQFLSNVGGVTLPKRSLTRHGLCISLLTILAPEPMIPSISHLARNMP